MQQTTMSMYPIVIFYQYLEGFIFKKFRLDVIRARSLDRAIEKLSMEREKHRNLQVLWVWYVEDLNIYISSNSDLWHQING